MALRDDDTVWTWGRNNAGQLGCGNTLDSDWPIPIDVDDVYAIEAGTSRSFVIKNDGTAWAWGSNYRGQLGDGTNTDSWLPVQVENLNNTISISPLGFLHSSAVMSDGTVMMWGLNSNGQLGTDTSIGNYELTPIEILNFNDVISTSTTYASSFAIKNDGTVWACAYVLLSV